MHTIKPATPRPAPIDYAIDPQTASVAVRIRIALASRRNRALRRAVAAARRIA